MNLPRVMTEFQLSFQNLLPVIDTADPQNQDKFLTAVCGATFGPLNLPACYLHYSVVMMTSPFCAGHQSPNSMARGHS